MRPTGSIGHMYSRFLHALAALFFTEIRDTAREEVLQYLTRCLVRAAGAGLPLYSPFLSRLQPYLDNTHVHYIQQYLLQYLTRCLVTAGMGLPQYSPCSRGFSLT